MNKMLLEWLDVPPNLVDQTWHVVLQRPWPTWLQVLVLMATNAPHHLSGFRTTFVFKNERKD